MSDPALVKLDPSRWVDDHGDCLYRYALVRVRTPEAAEDLVQDTLLVAVRTQDRFAGRSSERSWLVGILKHKIVDYYRRLGRETVFTDLESLKDEYAHKFVEGGWWNHDLGPHQWKSPSDEVMHQAEFWQTMRACLGKLPPRVADVFMLRKMEAMPSKEICQTLDVSESNLRVMLHRARMALRECLEIHWFDRTPAPAAGRMIWLRASYERLVVRMTPRCHDMTRLLSESMEHRLTAWLAGDGHRARRIQSAPEG